ncbi:hypothetical protein GQ44DRAFT_625199 [Phaeosphaeriaceae sp. PMI808]|nr:hypothetical protein GQ44DRAFT_625199 [Phaeosphaeriaceae sp. PMI808]
MRAFRKNGVPIFTSLIVALLFFGIGYWATFQQSPPTTSEQCEYMSTRREWRTLEMSQKYEYIKAVKCLRTKSSRLGLNQSLYDDFPWVHSRIGEYVHDAAPFLAWHRYFVHIYERALQEDCGYSKAMVYWDWELDWQNVTNAPIWDIEHGFGSDGNVTDSDKTIVGGHCVMSGPFERFSIPYLDEKYYPHCLSRGFLDGEALRKECMALSPDTIERLMAISDYSSFNLGLENGPHLAIPHSIRGDFSLLTAPSDPVFFLHHAQLDRLWWKWQNIHPLNRFDFEGRKAHGDNQSASSLDLLKMGGLAPDLIVAELLDTRSNRLCYQYQ